MREIGYVVNPNSEQSSQLFSKCKTVLRKYWKDYWNSNKNNDRNTITQHNVIKIKSDQDSMSPVTLDKELQRKGSAGSFLMWEGYCVRAGASPLCSVHFLTQVVVWSHHSLCVVCKQSPWPFHWINWIFKEQEQIIFFQSDGVWILFLRQKKKAKITEDHSSLHPWQQKQVPLTPLLRIM